MAPPPDPAHYKAVGDALLVYVTCLASILWWDALSLLPREINLVWKPFLSNKKRHSLFSIANFSVFFFAISRWLCFIQFIVIVWSIWSVWTPQSCDRFYLFDSVVSALVVSSSSGIMAIRVSALWGRQRLLDAPLFALWAALTAIVIWSSTFVEPVPGVTYCIAQQTSGNELQALYLTPMIFDVFILGLTAASAVKHKRNGRVGPLLQHLIKDGIIYFAAVFTCNLLAVAFEFQNLDPALKPVNASLATIGTSIFISRLFLSMREAVMKGVEIPTFHSDAVRSPNSKSSKWNPLGHSPKSKGLFSPKQPEGIPPSNRTQEIELRTEVAVDVDEDGRSTLSKARFSDAIEASGNGNGNGNGNRGLGVQMPTSSLPFDGENSVRSENFSSPRLTTVGDHLQFDKTILPASVKQD